MPDHSLKPTHILTRGVNRILIIYGILCQNTFKNLKYMLYGTKWIWIDTKKSDTRTTWSSPRVFGVRTIVAYQYLPTPSYHPHQQNKYIQFSKFYQFRQNPSSAFLPPLKAALIPHHGHQPKSLTMLGNRVTTYQFGRRRRQGGLWRPEVVVLAVVVPRWGKESDLIRSWLVLEWAMRVADL